MLHALLGLANREDVLAHPKVGASWEGFALEQVVRRLRARPEECFYWRTHTGAELDLLVVRGRRRLGFEFKRTTAPSLTPSMRSALADLGLVSLTVVHAGQNSFPLAPNVRALAFRKLIAEVKPIGWAVWRAPGLPAVSRGRLPAGAIRGSRASGARPRGRD